MRAVTIPAARELYGGLGLSGALRSVIVANDGHGGRIWRRRVGCGKMTEMSALGVMLVPFIVIWAAYEGLSDAQSVTNPKGTVKPSVIELKGKSPNRQAILLRVLDAGVLMYDRSFNHLIFYRWEQVERLETRRRRQSAW